MRNDAGELMLDTQTSAQGSIEYPASTIITYCSLLITL